MKWVYIILGIIASLILLILIIGALLPKKHKVSITRILPASQETMWNLITDFGGYKNWRTNLKSVEILGPDSWSEVDERNDKITFKIEVSEEPNKLITKIIDDKLPFGGSWTLELKSTGSETTELTITENGEIYNVIFRFFARFIFGYESTIKAYFEHLDNHLKN